MRLRNDGHDSAVTPGCGHHLGGPIRDRVGSGHWKVQAAPETNACAPTTCPLALQRRLHTVCMPFEIGPRIGDMGATALARALAGSNTVLAALHLPPCSRNENSFA